MMDPMQNVDLAASTGVKATSLRRTHIIVDELLRDGIAVSSAMILRRLRLSTIALLLLSAGVGCRHDEQAVIGVVAPMANEAIERIVEERLGLPPGTPAKVRIQFAAYTGGLGAQLPIVQAEQLVATPGLIGVVGHESSRSSLQAAPAYSEKGVVQIVPTGTSNKLATVSSWTFPLVASDSIQGELLANYVIRRRFSRVAVFVQDDEYGRDVLAELRRVLTGSSVVIADDITLVPGSDLHLLVRSALALRPEVDAFIAIAQDPVATQIARLAWSTRRSLTLLGSDAVTGSQVLADLAPSSEQLVLVTYWQPDTTDAATREFLRAFRQAVGRNAHWADAATFDAIGVLAAAANAVGNNPRDVRDWLQSLGTKRPAYRGLLGPIEFIDGHRIVPRLISPAPGGWRPVQ